MIISVATLMMLLVSFSPIIKDFLFSNKINLPTGVVFKSPCEQKTAQQQAQKTCQTFNNLQFSSILPTIFNNVLTLTDAIVLTFVLGFLTSNFVNRIYKPPKFQFVF